MRIIGYVVALVMTAFATTAQADSAWRPYVLKAGDKSYSSACGADAACYWASLEYAARTQNKTVVEVVEGSYKLPVGYVIMIPARPQVTEVKPVSTETPVAPTASIEVSRGTAEQGVSEVLVPNALRSVEVEQLPPPVPAASNSQVGSAVPVIAPPAVLKEEVKESLPLGDVLPNTGELAAVADEGLVVPGSKEISKQNKVTQVEEKMNPPAVTNSLDTHSGIGKLEPQRFSLHKYFPSLDFGFLKALEFSKSRQVQMVGVLAFYVLTTFVFLLIALKLWKTNARLRDERDGLKRVVAYHTNTTDAFYEVNKGLLKFRNQFPFEPHQQMIRLSAGGHEFSISIKDAPIALLVESPFEGGKPFWLSDQASLLEHFDKHKGIALKKFLKLVTPAGRPLAAA